MSASPARVSRLAMLTIVTLLTATIGAPGHAQVIPPDRLLPWDAGVRGGIPSVFYQVDVRDFGAVADGVTDDGPAFNDAIAAVEGAGFVWVPPGTYRIATIISMRDGVVLQGAGPDASRLLFDLPDFGFRGGIEFVGSMDSTETAVLSGYELLGTEIVVASADGLAPGSTLWLFQDDDEDAMYTTEYWRTDYSPNSMGQVVGVAAVDGDTVTLDAPLRLDYTAGLSPRFRVIHPIENAGVEGLYLERLDTANAYTIEMSYAQNCWVRHVESKLSYRSHIWAFYSRYLTISDNYFHEAHDYGDGGHGYGVTLGDCTSDVLTTNNVFHTLRHAMMVKEGANGNVFSYNYSFDNQLGKADGSFHGHYNYGNLFEGNVMRQLIVSDWWGPSGPYTTLFRNRTTSLTGISVRDHSHFTNVVGNNTRQITVQKGADIVILGYPVYMGGVEDELVDGNLVGTSIEWNGTPTTISESLYLSGPPEFWGGRPWPAIGADVDEVNDPDLRLPSQDRYDAIVAGTYAPPVPSFLLQEDLLVGSPTRLEVYNAEPGETVLFFYSFDGAGSGPCSPALGGLCLDLVAPRSLGEATADVDGVATLAFTVPPTTPLIEVSTQAAIQRGPGGADSVKTNPITTVVQE